MKTFALILPPFLGVIAGALHRALFSPRIAKLKPVSQSIGTPAVGVLWAFIPCLVSFSTLLHTLLKGKEKIAPQDFIFLSLISGAYSYITVFLGYGSAVVASIAMIFSGDPLSILNGDK